MMNKILCDNFDVAVIGGGPAGLMAAITAAGTGASVVLLEKNGDLGRKLLLTGNGRCNITNAENDLHTLISIFGEKGAFLFSGLSEFGPDDTMRYFHSLGLRTKTERGKRVFPVSEKSQDVLSCLLKKARETGVFIIRDTEVLRVTRKGHRKHTVITRNGEISCSRVIICTGGKSYPQTGSTGDGYRLAKGLGHTITQLVPSIVPIKVKEKWVKDLMGLTLKNCTLTSYLDGKKMDHRFGEMLFTHFGISGPIVMDMSNHIIEMMEQGDVTVKVDMKPALQEDTLDRRLQRDLDAHKGRSIHNALRDLLPSSMIPVILAVIGIPPAKKADHLLKSERKSIVHIIKGLELTVSGSLGFRWAIVTKGGVDLKEVDPRTMRSKLVDTLYFAGEILDLDGPTGGFNLQICWTTGYLAGLNAGSAKV